MNCLCKTVRWAVACLLAGLTLSTPARAAEPQPPRPGQFLPVPASLPLPTSVTPSVFGATQGKAADHSQTHQDDYGPSKSPSGEQKHEGDKAETKPEAKVPAITAGLTLAHLEQLALERNPTLAQAAAQVGASQSRALQAGLCPNPILSYDSEQMGAASQTRGSSWGERQGASLEQVIVTGGKLRLSRAKYNQEAYQAELQRIAQQHRVVNGLHTAFYEVLAAQKLIEVRKTLLENAQDAVKTSEEMANVGQGNAPDLLQAEVEGHRAKVSLGEAQKRYVRNWQYLVTLAGAPELPPTPLVGTLEPEGPPLEWESSLSRLLQESPELLNAQAEVVRDQITLQRERVEPIPDIRLRAATGYNFEVRRTTADVSVGFAIPVFNRNQGTIREVQYILAQAQAEVCRVELSLRRRLADAFHRYQNERESVEDYRTNSLPKSQKAYDLYQDYFRKRRAAWPQVLVAKRSLAQLQEEYIAALIDLRRAEVEIRGLLLVDGMSPPNSPTPQGHLESVPNPR